VRVVAHLWTICDHRRRAPKMLRQRQLCQHFLAAGAQAERNPRASGASTRTPLLPGEAFVPTLEACRR